MSDSFSKFVLGRVQNKLVRQNIFDAAVILKCRPFSATILLDRRGFFFTPLPPVSPHVFLMSVSEKNEQASLNKINPNVTLGKITVQVFQLYL